MSTAFRGFSLHQKLEFYFVIFFAIASPIIDLIIFKIIASLFVGSSGDNNLYLLFAVLVILFSANAILKYFSKIKKIECINRIIQLLNKYSNSILKSNINWLRMSCLESLNILISFGHVLIISMFSIFLNWFLGISLLGIASLFLIYFNLLFNRENVNQKKIRFNSKLVAYQRGEQNVLSRVKAAERVALVVNFEFFIFFAILIHLYSQEIINSQTGLIFLFIMRFICSNLMNAGSAMMRLARGWANIFDRFDTLTDSSRLG